MSDRPRTLLITDTDTVNAFAAEIARDLVMASASSFLQEERSEEALARKFETLFRRVRACLVDSNVRPERP